MLVGGRRTRICDIFETRKIKKNLDNVKINFQEAESSNYDFIRFVAILV